MKALLWVAGILLALFSASHVLIAYEHFQQTGPRRESVTAPVVIALAAAVLAVWVLRRARRGGTAGA